jgi:hypothetical protein
VIRNTWQARKFTVRPRIDERTSLSHHLAEAPRWHKVGLAGENPQMNPVLKRLVLALCICVPGSASVAADCANTGKTCLEAKRFHQRVCARVGSFEPRRNCYALNERAHDRCLQTGQWQTDQCNLSGLPKK